MNMYKYLIRHINYQGVRFENMQNIKFKIN